ncbi:FAD-dependent oxidoreductase [Lentibacillus lipolyticus]|nr:FAD-dependent oxidoreductase [Lentibacillus lipolyticus]
MYHTCQTRHANSVTTWRNSMTYDLVVIGAGPAGMSAAIKAAKAGAHVAIIDENPVSGGKLLGQLYHEPDSGWWVGRNIAREMIAKASSLGVAIFRKMEIWGIFPKWNIMLNNGERLTTEHVLIATGAAEKAIPVEGWTKPGVMAIGAAQTLTNFHRVKPGKKVVIIGVDPLSLSVAQELKMAGVEVAGIYPPPATEVSSDKSNPKQIIQGLSAMAHLAPNALLKAAGKAANHPTIKNIAAKCYPSFGVKVWGIPLHLRKTITAIEGEKQVEQVRITAIDGNGNQKNGRTKTMGVDCVCISGGLYPLSELAEAAGCDFVYIEELGGHVPLHSPELETTKDGIYVAGNITGIEGAKVAMAQGELAGTAISSRLGLLQKGSDAISEAQVKVQDARANAVITFQQHIESGREKLAQCWHTNVQTSSGKG